MPVVNSPFLMVRVLAVGSVQSDLNQVTSAYIGTLLLGEGLGVKKR